MNIVTAHPSPLLRSVLSGAFSAASDIEVRASAGTLPELHAACRSCRPQVALIAAAFPDGELALEVTEILRLGSRVLLLGDRVTTDLVAGSLLAGASGCLSLDTCTPDEVVAATREVAAGHSVLHPAAAATVLRLWRDARRAGDSATGRSAGDQAPALSPREREVVQALAAGWTTKQIGRQLVVSPKTVESHVTKLLAKLGARNRAHAVSVARSRGLLADDADGSGLPDVPGR